MCAKNNPYLTKCIGGFVRAVKLKVSWEEWDYCFHFSFLEVLDFIKDV